MKKQEIFDKVSRHLLTQNERSMCGNESRFCAYKGEKGLQCAIGCLLPDDIYDPIIEKKGVETVLVRNYLALAGIKREKALLMALQHVHDRSYVRYWKSCLEEIAVDFRLNQEVLKEFPETDNSEQRAH